MKFIAAFFCLLFFTFSLSAQKADEILATAGNKKFTAQNLKPETREMWLKLPKTLTEVRQQLFFQQIADVLLEAESAARKITVEKLFESEITAKVPAPTEAQIQTVYDANRASFAGKTLSEARPQIVAYLRREPEQKAYTNLIEHLKKKYKPLLAKDVNAPGIKPTDVLATIGAKRITFKDFTDKNRQRLYEFEAEVFDRVLANLKEIVSAELLAAEAAETNVSTSDIMAREITDKLREYTEAERAGLEAALNERLFEKYKARFLIKEPAPPAQNISADDDPAKGSATAPVTIVMFADFQCSYCAATHPVLQRVMAEYKDKIRFVARDFPLESIHADAFGAALAANAARAQGKYFEYAEILYQNQTALDTESLKRYAAALGLNLEQFTLDLTSEKNAAEIRKDMADGKNYGISGTPAIFINGIKVRDTSAEGFRNAIEKALKK